VANDESDERIVRYTAEELAEKRRRGETLSDWERIRNTTEEEVEASINFEEEGEFDWDVTHIGSGAHFTEANFTFLCDADIVAWFQQRGANPEVRIADESRMLSIAMLDDTCVAAVWTERNGRTRLISVRHARRGERALFQRKTGIQPGGA
jgi:uncharacterized DUF497 family protein